MKNFLELLDINNTDINIKMILLPIVDNGFPDATVIINHLVLFDDVLESEISLNVNIPLLSTIDISVEMRNKKYDEIHETAIIIKQLSFDNFDLVPNYNHHFVYTNEHNNGSPTNYLGVNGIWSLNINEPFYNWKHRILGNGWLLQP